MTDFTYTDHPSDEESALVDGTSELYLKEDAE